MQLPQQKSTTSGEYSFDLELGASASKVYQRQKETEMMESLKPSSYLQKLPKGILLLHIPHMHCNSNKAELVMN